MAGESMTHCVEAGEATNRRKPRPRPAVLRSRWVKGSETRHAAQELSQITTLVRAPVCMHTKKWLQALACERVVGRRHEIRGAEACSTRST